LGKFSGNFIFASLNACRGYNKSRRDDVESMLYVLFYMLNDNELPWSDFESRLCGNDFDLRRMLKERLQSSYTRRLFSLIPSTIGECFKKVLLLEFSETPNYQELRTALVHCLIKSTKDKNPQCPPSVLPSTRL